MNEKLNTQQQIIDKQLHNACDPIFKWRNKTRKEKDEYNGKFQKVN